MKKSLYLALLILTLALLILTLALPAISQPIYHEDDLVNNFTLNNWLGNPDSLYHATNRIYLLNFWAPG
jgi:hypothetical protein